MCKVTKKIEEFVIFTKEMSCLYIFIDKTATI